MESIELENFRSVKKPQVEEEREVESTTGLDQSNIKYVNEWVHRAIGGSVIDSTGLRTILAAPG